MFLVLAVLLAFGYIFQKIFNGVDKTNWEETFNGNKKNAFDLYIFTQEIDSLLPTKKINKYNTDLAKYTDSVINLDYKNQAILVIKPYFFEEPNLDYIRAGNSVFIVTTNMFSGYYPISEHVVPKNTPLTFTNKQLQPYATQLNYPVHFSTADFSGTYPKEVLATAENQEIFVRYKIGKGYLYLVHTPHVFSNQYLTQNDAGFPSAILSYIDQNEVTLITEGQPKYKKYAENDYDDSTPGLLSFILSNRYLKTAWYIFVIGGLVFVLFRAKRVQRVIPILTPNKNKTLEFVQTISSIYYNDKNNLAIIKKMNAQFLDKIEKRYLLKTDNLGASFGKKLAHLTGKPEAEITQILLKIKFYNSSTVQPSRAAVNQHYINLKKIIQ
ncbi:hypothetical protein K5I29_07390 [Flavobacterium agricola]|uniref:DUF4350 domain-containing protein n=1 Tax=Flavobacterium agricola TaxID=2870839 RepID=A0ABY6LVP0_9FLAO|nr:hypothetical protein [Flavobacterium agricola]UYW00393.1 hypothetical protein K5I29_07390 [Flavobacterium agricola]